MWCNMLGEAEKHSSVGNTAIYIKYPGKGLLKPQALSRLFQKDNSFAFCWSMFCWNFTYMINPKLIYVE